MSGFFYLRMLQGFNFLFNFYCALKSNLIKLDIGNKCGVCHHRCQPP